MPREYSQDELDAANRLYEAAESDPSLSLPMTKHQQALLKIKMHALLQLLKERCGVTDTDWSAMWERSAEVYIATIDEYQRYKAERNASRTEDEV